MKFFESIRKRLTEEAPSVSPHDPDCPPALPGFAFAFKVISPEGECVCIYKRISDPTDWYARPCNP